MAARIWVGSGQGKKWMVEGGVFNRWLQYGVQEYWWQFSEGWGWVHECDSFSDNCKRELTSLVQYFTQSWATGDIVQDIWLFCYRVLDIFWVKRGKKGMKHSKYQKELWATASCTKRMMEATKGIGQKSIKWVLRIFSFLKVGSPPRRP